MTHASSETVARIVQEQLRADEVAGAKVRVLGDKVRLGDPNSDWWWVPVEFQADPFKVYFYYELFSSIEDRLLEGQGLNVLLVPRVIPLPDEAS